MDLRSISNRNLLKISALFLGIILIAAILTASYPPFEEQFIAMAILGKNGEVNNYFPENISRIEVGTQISWYIYVYNHMDIKKDISIRVKLLNSSLEEPNDNTGEPSPALPFIEIPLTLERNETLIFPFVFSLPQVTLIDQSVKLTMIDVNNAFIPLDVSAVNGLSFRFIFELWVYNEVQKTFEFSWKDKAPVWNQIWFDINI